VSDTPYLWRQLTSPQRSALLTWRQTHCRPWHSPPHRPNFGQLCFHLTAACYEHRPYIGHSPQRMDTFAGDLQALFAAHATRTFAWCVLPNHYHALVEAPDVLELLHELGRLHGRTSYTWNGAENTRGRKVFFRAAERAMRSERHFWATMNYVHHNPVHHRYVEQWTDWAWSSAAEYLAQTGRGEAERIWREYPIHDYGKGWDEAEM
jgi:putative transposase